MASWQRTPPRSSSLWLPRLSSFPFTSQHVWWSRECYIQWGNMTRVHCSATKKFHVWCRPAWVGSFVFVDIFLNFEDVLFIIVHWCSPSSPWKAFIQKFKVNMSQDYKMHLVLGNASISDGRQHCASRLRAVQISVQWDQGPAEKIKGLRWRALSQGKTETKGVAQTPQTPRD